MTPEKEARILIDQQLRDAGWILQDAKGVNLSEGLGIAVREFPLNSGYADYLLYADGKAIGVVEAKPAGFPLQGVETRSSKYTFGLPKDLPHYRLPLPSSYETMGNATQFTDALEPDFRSREVLSFHRPEDVIRVVTSKESVLPVTLKMSEVSP